MHIVYVTGEFARDKRDSALSGMAKAVYLCAKGMLERGHEVEIVTAASNQKEWSYEGIKVNSIYSPFNVNKNFVEVTIEIIKREMQISNIIKKIHNKNPIDIIQYTGWFGIGLLHNKKIPAVMRVSTYSKFQLAGEYSKIKLQLLSYMEQLAAKKMNVIFAPSCNTALALQKDIKRKVYVLETPYVKNIFVENNSIVQNKLKEKKYLLFFGRMTVDKGIDVIKNILYELLKENSDLFFVFAGDIGDKKKELQKAAKEYRNRVLFLGRLKHEELFPVIRKAELIIMPSLMDNFPNSCAEAMSIGKIVIGTDGSSLEQFIKNGENGFLAEINNSQSLLEKIEEALNLEEEKKNKLSINAIKRIEKLNPEKYYKKLENLYFHVIEKSKGEGKYEKRSS